MPLVSFWISIDASERRRRRRELVPELQAVLAIAVAVAGGAQTGVGALQIVQRDPFEQPEPVAEVERHVAADRAEHHRVVVAVAAAAVHVVAGGSVRADRPAVAIEIEEEAVQVDVPAGVERGAEVEPYAGRFLCRPDVHGDARRGERERQDRSRRQRRIRRDRRGLLH